MADDAHGTDVGVASDELHRLRERAYGRTADIHEDPQAVRRLEQLEAALASFRQQALDGEPPEPVRSPPEVAQREPGADAPQDGPLDLPPLASSSPPTISPRLWRWVPALWIGSILLATGLAVAAMAMWAVSAYAPITRGPADAHRFAVLVEAPEPAPSGFLGSVDVRSFGEFYGLTVLAPAPARGAMTPQHCLVIVRTADYRSTTKEIRDPVYTGCSAGRFHATVQLSVDGEAPDALKALFADGTALQFVLDGSKVGVFTDR